MAPEAFPQPKEDGPLRDPESVRNLRRLNSLLENNYYLMEGLDDEFGGSATDSAAQELGKFDLDLDDFVRDDQPGALLLANELTVSQNEYDRILAAKLLLAPLWGTFDYAVSTESHFEANKEGLHLLADLIGKETSPIAIDWLSKNVAAIIGEVDGLQRQDLMPVAQYLRGCLDTLK